MWAGTELLSLLNVEVNVSEERRQGGVANPQLQARGEREEEN